MRPFEGLRVIDMTHVFAGPFCSFQLAVLGADVIKVEDPAAPDMMRREGADAALNAAGYGLAFIAQNGGKRGICVDIRTARGRRIITELVRGADVLVENWRGGALERLGLGHEPMRKLNPRLIYCSLTGFGAGEPKGTDPAYDNVVQAFSGMMAANGEAGRDAVRIGPPVVDYGTGAQAALAIAAALFRRATTGEGTRIDVSMLDAAFMLMSSMTAATAATGRAPQRHGSCDGDYAGYGAYETAEGVLMIGAWTNRQQADLFRALGDAGRAAAVAGLPRPALVARREEDSAFLRRVLMGETAAEWEARLNRAGVPAARVRGLDEALCDEQVAARRGVQANPGRARAGVPERLPVAAYGYDRDGPALDRAPPEIGEHTAEILRELGYDAAAQAELEDAGIVRCAAS